MQARHATVRLDDLAWEDGRFAIRSFLPHEALEISLERHGMLYPPWAWEREDGRYTILDGFKRLAWARPKGVQEVPCLVFPAACPYEELLLLRVEGKRFGPPLNPAEKAQIIAQSAGTLPDRLVSERLLPALGIPRRKEAVKGWCRLSEAGEDLLEAAASGEVSERAALDLSTWGEEERGGMLVVLKELRCSAGIQMEITERIREIALREDRQRLSVLRRPEFCAVLNDRNTNHRQKTAALRALLTRWRFPRLSAREERFASEWSAVSLPRSISLSPPPGFEGEEWRFQITFSSPLELRELLQRAEDFASSPRLESLLSARIPE